MEKEGFRITVHHSRDKAVMSTSSFDVGIGLITDIVVTPTSTETTMAAKQRFDPFTRDCYFDDEFESQFLSTKRYRYSETNCLLEEYYKAVHDQCHCRPFSKDPVEDNLVDDDFRYLCVGEQLLCQRKLESELLHGKSNKGVGDKCLDSCNYETYTFHVKTTHISKNVLQLSKMKKIACPLLRKIKLICKTKSQGVLLQAAYPGICGPYDKADQKYIASCANYERELTLKIGSKGICNPTSTEFLTGTIDPDLERRVPPKVCKDLECRIDRYANDNIAIVRIYFESLKTKKFVKDQATPVIWFVASIGGILGLCDGISMITMMETSDAFIGAFIHYMIQIRRYLKEASIRKERMNDPERFRFKITQQSTNI